MFSTERTEIIYNSCMDAFDSDMLKIPWLALPNKTFSREILTKCVCISPTPRHVFSAPNCRLLQEH